MINNTSNNNFTRELPNEIIVKILGYLDPHTLNAVSLVDKHLYQIVRKFFRDSQERMEYQLLYKVYEFSVLSKENRPEVNRLIELYTFFGTKIERVVTEIPRRKVLPTGEIPKDFSLKLDHLAKCKALVEYFELFENVNVCYFEFSRFPYNR